MKKNRKNRTFDRNATRVSTVLSTVKGGRLSHCVNGMSQPLKKSDVMSALAVTMFAYSAMKKSENFIAEYSVWYPATSSDSASGRSNGRRFVSANAETRKMKNAIERTSTFHPIVACCRMIVLSETFPERSSTQTVDIPIAIS